MILLRDAPTGVETWLGYRRGCSPLGVVAFPGGSIEPSDDDAVGWLGPLAASSGPRTWGLTDEGRPAATSSAAIRETFEETGILLAGPDLSPRWSGVQAPSGCAPARPWRPRRRPSPRCWPSAGLSVRTDLLKPLVNWLSPDFAHRRFNTRYFAATLPMNQQPSLLASKGVWGRWVCVRGSRGERDTTCWATRSARRTPWAGRWANSGAGSEIMLEKMAKANGCIAYLSHKRKASTSYQPSLGARRTAGSCSRSRPHRRRRSPGGALPRRDRAPTGICPPLA